MEKPENSVFLPGHLRSAFPGQKKGMVMLWKLVFAVLPLYMSLPVLCRDTLYVSPHGNDSWDGSADRPFSSLYMALEQAGKETASEDTLYVEVAQGDYILDRPLIIDRPFGRPVSIQGRTGAKPRLTGGIRVSGWEDLGNGIFRAHIAEVERYGFDFEQFYVDRRRCTWARTPDTGWHFVQNCTEHPFSNESRPAYAVQKVVIDSSDASSLRDLTIQEMTDVRVRFYHKWDITRKKASFIMPDSSSVFIQGEGMKPWNPLDRNTRYFLYGYKGALDSPGEWWLDRKSGYVYYIPRPGEDLSSADCIAPAARQWIVVKGTEKEPVRDVCFKNLSFMYSSYRMPDTGNEPMQAAALVEAAIEVDNASGIVFKDCDMEHTGGYAVWFRSACQGCRIERCFIADLGAGGVKIGDPLYIQGRGHASSHNTVLNSIITHAGSEFPCGVGVAIFHASDNSVVHNEISDLRYSGVSVGWTWGYNHDGIVSPAVRNIVAYNHIHHIGWGELSDMGAVYTLGESPGTKVIFNVIHDVFSYGYGGWGLYTDEGSTGVEMSSNLVYRCKSGGFHQHYGKDNVIENNIFAFGTLRQAQYTRSEPHLSFRFRHNIILQDKGETLSGPWLEGNIDMDFNLYWHTGGEPRFGDMDFAEWNRKKEGHSVMADPLFVAPYDDDFSFRSMKNARRIGFRPVDFSKAGVYGPDSWKARARMSPEISDDFRDRVMADDTD